MLYTCKVEKRIADTFEGADLIMTKRNVFVEIFTSSSCGLEFRALAIAKLQT